jgi:glycosyltransferase involved in cell wall biosynthesis
MHVLLGATLLSGTPGYRQAGIHQYTRALLEAFSDVLSAGDLRDLPRITALISPTARAALPLSILQSPIPNPQSPISFRAASRSTERPLDRLRVEQFEAPRLLRELAGQGEPVAYHGLAFAAPLRAPSPTIVTVHDLSFLTRPETHRPFNRLYLSLITRRSCQRAARVIAVSEWTRRDVTRLLGVPLERIDVIPHGVHPRFKPLPEAEVADFRRAKGIGERSVFFLGSLEPRKNLVALVEAFGAVRDQKSEVRSQTGKDREQREAGSAQLIVGGAPGWKYGPIFERVKALGLEDAVRFEGPIAHDDLPLWYNACAAFAYPSLYEGFGLPALEAMACGAAVVASDVTSLPEVVGGAGLLVAPTDVAGLAEAIQRVLDDRALRADLSRRALARAAGFTWRRAAERTLETYKRALGVES